MIKIRLARYGKKNDPFYRVVAIDSQKKPTGKFLANLGFWHPQSKQVKIEKEAISEWVSKGAQVSPAVTKLMQ